jgi:hypothetical protein
MADLIEIVRPASLGADRVYDPEAAAAEALDLIKITEGAATAERQRIIALMKQQAFEWADQNGNTSVASALNSLAMRLEAGQ